MAPSTTRNNSTRKAKPNSRQTKTMEPTPPSSQRKGTRQASQEDDDATDAGLSPPPPTEPEYKVRTRDELMKLFKYFRPRYRDGDWFCQCRDQQDVMGGVIPTSNEDGEMYFACARGFRHKRCNFVLWQEEADILKEEFDKGSPRSPTRGEKNASTAKPFTADKPRGSGGRNVASGGSQSTASGSLNATGARLATPSGTQDTEDLLPIDCDLDDEVDFPSPPSRPRRPSTRKGARSIDQPTMDSKESGSDDEAITVVTTRSRKSVGPPAGQSARANSSVQKRAGTKRTRSDESDSEDGKEMPAAKSRPSENRFHVVTVGLQLGIFGPTHYENVKHVVEGVSGKKHWMEKTLDAAIERWRTETNNEVPVPEVQPRPTITAARVRRKPKLPTLYWYKSVPHKEPARDDAHSDDSSDGDAPKPRSSEELWQALRRLQVDSALSGRSAVTESMMTNLKSIIRRCGGNLTTKMEEELKDVVEDVQLDIAEWKRKYDTEKVERMQEKERVNTVLFDWVDQHMLE